MVNGTLKKSLFGKGGGVLDGWTCHVHSPCCLRHLPLVQFWSQLQSSCSHEDAINCKIGFHMLPLFSVDQSFLDVNDFYSHTCCNDPISVSTTSWAVAFSVMFTVAQVPDRLMGAMKSQRGAENKLDFNKNQTRRYKKTV